MTQAQDPAREAGRRCGGGRRAGDRPLAAIAWMLAAALCFTLLDGIGKLLVREYPVAQVVWVRYLTFTLVLLAGVSWARGWRRMATARLPAHMVRALLLVLTTVSVYSAARSLPLSQIYAIAHLAPLMVAMLASAFLHERVRPAVWGCIGLGFVGALMIIRPEVGSGASAAVVAGVAWSFGMAVGIAGYQTMTRVLGSTESPAAQMFYAAILGLALTTPTGLAEWRTPSLTALVLMAAMGAAGYLAQWFLVKAFTLGEAALVAPFNYSTLVWSGLFDALVFGRLPGATTFAGAAVIVGSGVAIVILRVRESRKTLRQLARAGR